MNVNNYGDCGLCGVAIEQGLSLEPFGNCCQNCIDDVKQFGTSRTLTEINCGACGQYFEQDKSDSQGHHLEEYCDAAN